MKSLQCLLQQSKDEFWTNDLDLLIVLKRFFFLQFKNCVLLTGSTILLFTDQEICSTVGNTNGIHGLCILYARKTLFHNG